MKTQAILSSLATVVLLASCDHKPKAKENAAGEPAAETRTIETSRLKGAIDAYEKEPSAGHQADVDKAFAALDEEIAELNERIAKTTGKDREEAAAKVKNLTEYRTAETARFAKVKAHSAASPSPDARSATQKVEEEVKEAGEAAKDAAHETGEAIKRAAEKAEDALKRD